MTGVWSWTTAVMPIDANGRSLRLVVPAAYRDVSDLIDQPLRPKIQETASA